MPRRPSLTLPALALVAACSGSSPASGPVPVAPASSSSSATASACRALVAQLPQRLGDAARRRATPDVRTTAAWGDPPITLVCGGSTGSPLDDTFTVDEVRWAVHDIGPGNAWTTLDRSPAVRVTFPDRYQNQAELLTLLVGPLTRTPLTPGRLTPSG